jgi:hypothetical protein
MPAFLVTGNPGSGKSALARELGRRGVLAIDPDEDPELAYWEDAGGRRVSGPSQPDGQWLGSHRWVWSRSRLEQVLAGHGRAVFVCGIARNQGELLDLFDRVFVLRIDEATQEARSPRMMRGIRRAAARRGGRRSGRAGPRSRRRCCGLARPPSTVPRLPPWSPANCSP